MALLPHVTLTHGVLCKPVPQCAARVAHPGVYSMDPDDVTISEVLALRNCQGLSEIEIWSILCQSAQSLQDLFLAYDERKKYDPIITLDSLLITSQGRVLIKPFLQGCFEPKDIRFLAPEFDSTLPQPYAELQMEKMWLYSLGVCVKSMFLSSLVVSRKLSDIVLQLTRKDTSLRCSLLTLLNKRSSSHVDMDVLTNAENIVTDKNSIETQRRPIQRAPSRLYKVDADVKGPGKQRPVSPIQTCVGPEFVIRATRPPSMIHIGDIKFQHQRKVLIILLNGHKLEVTCDVTITAGQLFEVVVQNEYITENFTLGLAALVSGDFVFLPSDSRLHRVLPSPATSKCPYSAASTLYLRVKFYLPSLRGIRCPSWKHQLYLQLRSNVLTRQLRCDSVQLFTLAGLALQAEFGNYSEQKHGEGDYFLLEHYLPESSITASCEAPLIAELQGRHRERKGVLPERAEDLFIVFCQQLSEYGTHFYSAHLACKELKTFKGEVWLGVNLHGVFFCSKQSTSRTPTQLFMWSNIKKLEYQKHAFCLITQVKSVKFKFKMENHKSYYVFHLASLHHKFFCKLRAEMSLKSLSDEFGVPVISKSKLDSKLFYVLKDEKKKSSPKDKVVSLNAQRANILQPLCNKPKQVLGDVDTNQTHRSCNISNRNNVDSSKSSPGPLKCLPAGGGVRSLPEMAKTLPRALLKCKRNRENSRASMIDKENVVPDSNTRASCVSLSQVNTSNKSQLTPKLPRRFTPNPSKLFSSQQSLHSISSGMRASQASLHTLSRPGTPAPEVYILNPSLKCSTGEGAIFDPQESISDSLAYKFENLSWTEDDRLLTTVRLKKSPSGCLGVEVTEGLDGGVYIQSVLHGGPADKLGNIHPGDRIVSVNGQDLLSVKYKKALLIIQRSGSVLELVLSQSPLGVNSASMPPRRPRSVCTDLFTQSHIEQAYLRSIRYETAPDDDHMESGDLPSLSSPQSGLLPSLSHTGLDSNRRSMSNGQLASLQGDKTGKLSSTGSLASLHSSRHLFTGELTSLPLYLSSGKSVSIGEIFHATQSFII